MSSPPEEEVEIEEGEIVSESESDSDVEIVGDMIEDDEDEDEEGIDIMELMGSLLATPEGDTVCSALVNIALQLQTQNKILIKMLTKIQKNA
ncbi:hypothetical protein FK873_gp090 [Micromonas pusilla virus SP1]|jgi:hypothetical protein|uniref:Uncharacterized protein n=1 Tax=Micromonas pusilla virus SP1 TaxID=373996 RepID=G9E661_MPSP1|nr:hypothetical protein FK873_gp090 [Micromonas pusilla virus SP1]AET84888.1 hypothetical protein MPXG_00090 [Micromonas pusilla virus SP1]|tara:strand:- start:4171 stop:4446 length:276 start_codon:yes stop_codon:yes gene_type:complete